MQDNISTFRFELVYEGTAVNNGSMEASQLASVVQAMSALIEYTNRVVNGDRTPARLNVSGIRDGSTVIQLVLELAVNVDLQTSIDVAISAKELVRLLVGGATITVPSVGGLFMLFKRFRRRQPMEIVNQDNQVVTIKLGKDTSIPVFLDACELYRRPEIRECLHDLVEPIVDSCLDRLVIRDDDDVLDEITRDEANRWLVEETETREMEQLETLETIHEELRDGIHEMKQLIQKDISDWAFMGRTMTEINERLDKIEQRMQ